MSIPPKGAFVKESFTKGHGGDNEPISSRKELTNRGPPPNLGPSIVFL